MLTFKLIGGIVSTVIIFGGLLLLPAGTLDWWRAWVFLGVVFVASAASTASVFRVNKGLVEERLKPPIHEGQPFADVIIVVLFAAASAGFMVFIPLDVVHFHLLPKPGTLVSSLGLFLFVAGWWIDTLALMDNAFAVPVVRHQEERNHVVVDRGVYSVVRHPIYAGAVPLLVGMALWLESYAGALAASVPIGVLVMRILIEERFLKQELKGYDAYTKRVRYRIIPYLW